MVNANTARQGLTYFILVALRRVSAAIVVMLSLRITAWAYDAKFNEPYVALSIIAALMALMFFSGDRQKADMLPPRLWNISLSAVSRWCLLIAILLLLGYATKTSSIFSRKVLFTWFVMTPPFLVLVQLSADILISRLLLSAGNMKRVVIAGADELGHNLALKIQSSPYLCMKTEGFFDDRGLERLSKGSSLPLLGKLGELAGYVREHNIDLIFVVLPIRNIQRVTDLLNQLHDTTASIYFVPDVFVFDLIQCRTSDISGLPIVALCETPFQGSQGLIKAASDYAIASMVLLLTSPIMILIALAIKLTSSGSVIFKQRRYGLDGREIIIYKFRTMTVSEDSDHVKQAGRMSVVGPRPHAVAHNEEYRPLIKGYMMRHKVNPGITGLAQVMGYRGETSTVDAMQKRVECDLEYLRNWSLSLDLRIIFRTLRVVINDKMAF